MKQFCCVVAILTAAVSIGCAAKSEPNSASELASKELEAIQAELSISLKEPAISHIQYRVITDLQFELGCREQGIPTEKCDYRNTLTVEFEEFDCYSNNDPDNQFTSLAGLKDGGAKCDYKGTINFVDGRSELIERKSELYNLEYYSDGLSHEYLWTKSQD